MTLSLLSIRHGLAACLVVAGFMGAISDGAAQTPQPAAPAQRRPAAPTQGKPAAPAKPRQVSGITLGWIKHCAEVGSPPALSCVTQQELRTEAGEFISSLALQEPPTGSRKRLAIGVPLGVWLISELSLRFDQGKPIEAKYGTCLANGCFGVVEANAELLQQMRRAKMVVLTIHDAYDLPIEVQMPLESFLNAVDGAPSDISESEETQKQWVGNLVTRAQARDAQKLNPDAPAQTETPPGLPAPTNSAGTAEQPAQPPKN